MMTFRITGSTAGQSLAEVDLGGGVASIPGKTATPPAHASEVEASFLPEPLQSFSSGGDLLAELTVLLTLASQKDREIARESQLAEDILRTQQENLKVQKMHEQADDIRSAAWSEGLAEIGQGVCQIGAGTIDCKPGKLDWNDVSQAMSKGFAAAGTTISGQFKGMEKLDQADAEEAGANADRAGRGSKQAGDEIDNARDMLKKIASFYEQMLQAQSASMTAAANWRA